MSETLIKENAEICEEQIANLLTENHLLQTRLKSNKVSFKDKVLKLMKSFDCFVLKFVFFITFNIF